MRDMLPADSRLLLLLKANQHNLSQPRLRSGWNPKGVSASLAPKLLITSELRIVACWKTWIAWIQNDTGVVLVGSLNYIYIQQRVYISPSKTQSEASHFFPHTIETKLQQALPSYFPAPTPTKAISQDGVSLCRSRYVLSGKTPLRHLLLLGLPNF